MAFVPSGSSSGAIPLLSQLWLGAAVILPLLLLPPLAIMGAGKMDAFTLSGSGIKSVGAGLVDFCSR